MKTFLLGLTGPAAVLVLTIDEAQIELLRKHQALCVSPVQSINLGLNAFSWRLVEDEGDEQLAEYFLRVEHWQPDGVTEVPQHLVPLLDALPDVEVEDSIDELDNYSLSILEVDDFGLNIRGSYEYKEDEITSRTLPLSMVYGEPAPHLV